MEPERRTRAITILLPEIDQYGNQARWRSWAQAAGARIVFSEGVGQDIRAAWPAALVHALEEGREADRAGERVAWVSE